MPLDPKRYDVVVVGAGPPGSPRRFAPAEAGAKVALVDDNPDLGGQIWRGERHQPTSPEARIWFARLQPPGSTSGPAPGSSASEAPRSLMAERAGNWLNSIILP